MIANEEFDVPLHFLILLVCRELLLYIVCAETG
jgi:hypothetical protein